MWSFVQFLNSLVAPQSDAEKAASVERRFFEGGAPDTQTAALSPDTRDSSGGTNGERAVQKLKGYFSLAKEEIEKGVRSEEWGLTEDAVAHYKKANHILVEGSSAPLDVEPGSASYENVTSYRKKMTQWQEKVLERLRVLNNRSVAASKAQAMDKRPIVPQPPKRRPMPPVQPHPVTPARAPGNPTTPSRASMNPPNRQPVTANAAAQPVAIKGLDPKLVETIENDIVDRSPAVSWDDIAGLARAKLALMEMVILPSIRSDLFQGLRKPARGLLLFGPPGNGKTMLAKAVASESAATFFSISASSLTSKWVGEGEKLVKALFGIAAARQPSVIFVDEIDSIMSSRSAGEHEASRRLKTEFLVQFDGVISNENDRIIVMAATNRPEELDDAVRRRLVKRIYIPLPDAEGRKALLQNLLKGQTTFSLHGSELDKLIKSTEGYSGSDLHALCQEAAMMPLRELGSQISTIRSDQIRALTFKDFREALKVIRPSVSKEQLAQYEQFNDEFGSLA
ncbi:unnamed protein product [Calypogeia fissa]